MKRLVIAITAFVIGWYICGFFAIQALDYFFPSLLFFNGWIENILLPEYMCDIFGYFVFLACWLGGVGLVLPFEPNFTIGTVSTHHRNRYHRRYRETKADEAAIKRFVRLMSILTICIFMVIIISNALFCEYLALCFSLLLFISLGMIHGATFIQMYYGKAR